jgi:hypothetical protein
MPDAELCLGIVFDQRPVLNVRGNRRALGGEARGISSSGLPGGSDALRRDAQRRRALSGHHNYTCRSVEVSMVILGFNCVLN